MSLNIKAPGKEVIKHYIITDEKLTMDCEHHDAKFYVDDPVSTIGIRE